MKKSFKALIALVLGTVMIISAAAMTGCVSNKKDSVAEHEHVAAAEWTQDATTGMHYHACTYEGCTERLDEAACAKAEGAELQSDDENHWYKCIECDQPVEVEAHTFTLTDNATYLAAGTVTKTCSVCKKVVETDEVAPKKTMTVGSTGTLTGTATSKTLTAQHADTETTISLKYDMGSIVGYMDLDTTANTAKIKICMPVDVGGGYIMTFVIMAASTDDVDTASGEMMQDGMFLALGEGTLATTETGYTATWGTGDTASTYIITKGEDGGYTATLDKTTNSGGTFATEGMSTYFQDMYDVNYATATVSMSVTWGEDNTVTAATVTLKVGDAEATTVTLNLAADATAVGSWADYAAGEVYDYSAYGMGIYYDYYVVFALAEDGSLSATVINVMGSVIQGFALLSCAAPVVA